MEFFVLMYYNKYMNFIKYIGYAIFTFITGFSVWPYEYNFFYIYSFLLVPVWAIVTYGIVKSFKVASPDLRKNKKYSLISAFGVVFIILSILFLIEIFNS